jgi:hypothetical protein
MKNLFILLIIVLIFNLCNKSNIELFRGRRNKGFRRNRSTPYRRHSYPRYRRHRRYRRPSSRYSYGRRWYSYYPYYYHYNEPALTEQNCNLYYPCNK